LVNVGVATLEKEMIEFRHRNHFNHPLAVSYSTPYVSSGYSSYDWGSAAPSTSQHAVYPHPTTSFFGEMNSNFGNNSQQLSEDHSNYGSQQQEHASSRRLDEAQSNLTFSSSVSKVNIYLSIFIMECFKNPYILFFRVQLIHFTQS
jgi:hypothetical protein